MPERCKSCGLITEREPGFFYGAMYVGYAISIAWLTACFVGAKLLFPGFSLLWFFIIAIGSLFILTPVVFRLSRSIWFNIFVHYNPAASEKWLAENDGNPPKDFPCKSV